MTESSESGSGRSKSKVERVMETYGLDGYGEELAARWLGEHGEKQSLRSLADEFNREVLGAAMRDAGMSPLEGEVENAYRLLTDGDVSEGMRTQTRSRLEAEGVDVEQIQRNFVSHQAIHTYLTEHRGVSYEVSEQDQLEKDLDRINRLQSRLVAVVEDSLDRSRNAERLTVGDADVFVETRVLCSDCGASYPVAELVDRGGCDCERS